ncbi:prepilin peptidase [Candidatus Parcubacteria bacterium]|nr:prepilin peptidase [Candidatus Parcubacteria bacterium]
MALGILIFVIGASIGSFLNVVIYRYHTGMTFGGRSICLYCGKELRWFELLPIFSFLYLKGRCATCKSRLSFQYPLVELAAALSFVGLYLHSSASYVGTELVLHFLLFAAALSLLIVIAAYDIRHTIIPDAFAYSLAALGLLRVAFFPGVGEGLTMALLAGPCLALPFALLFFLSRGRLMGLGDAKLALGIGWLLGLPAGIVALFLSFWLGGIAAVFLLFAARGRVTMKSEIPFAPYLVLGTALSLFFAERYFLPLIF